MALQDRWGTPDTPTPMDFNPLEQENAKLPALDEMKDQLETMVLQYGLHEVDVNRQTLFSRIVTTASKMIECLNAETNSEIADPKFGLSSANIKKAQKGELSMSPADERAMINRITLATSNTTLWRAEPEPA